MEERLQTLNKKANELPLLPGVYIMRGKDKKIIYIGKAKILKNRVTQYFRSQERHNEKVRQMVAHVQDFDYIICDSEFEALILEASLIKQNNPKYNIKLKDDKGYHYIHITDEKWKRISEEKMPLPDGENIGPFNSSSIVRQSLDEAKKIYKLPLCSKSFSDDMKKTRPCLNHFIGLCQAPCAGKVTYAEYIDSVNGAIEFLKKGSSETVKVLTQRMNDCAERLEFEKAAKLRDKINAIHKIVEKQKVVLTKIDHADVVAFVKGQKNACFEVFRFRGGSLCDREHFFVDSATEDSEARSQFLFQYYSMRADIPQKIITDGAVQSAQQLEQWLSEKSGKRTSITIPQKGESKQLLEMCRSNAAERVAQKEGRALHEAAVLDELRALLGLNKIPEYIEAYDISNTAGQDNVAGMVVFKNGKPLKKAYRKFAIKSFEGQDDYASMREVLTRRMLEYEEHRPQDSGFGRLPDVILIDGGIGQLHAVLPVLEKYQMQDHVFGMVKDSHHKTRALVGRDGEIAIKPTRMVFKLITEIQDEVHRFSVAYHHQKASNRTFSLQLTAIEGIGKTKAENLMKHFKSLNAVAAADIDALKEVQGITEKNAQAIYDFYHRF